MQRSARKVRPVGPCPEGTNVDIFFETLVIDTGKAREPYVSASRGPHEATNTLTVYTPPQKERCAVSGLPRLKEGIQRHIHGRVPTNEM